MTEAAQVLKNVLASEVALDLTEEQADELWLECRERLMNGFQTTIHLVETSKDGQISGVTLNDVKDVVSHVLTGKIWPDCTNEAAVAIFIDRLSTAVKARGYKMLG